jgi:hypothetical protein
MPNMSRSDEVDAEHHSGLVPESEQRSHTSQQPVVTGVNHEPDEMDAVAAANIENE